MEVLGQEERSMVDCIMELVKQHLLHAQICIQVCTFCKLVNNLSCDRC